MIDPKLLDVVLPFDSGYPAHLAAEDTRDSLMMAAREAGAVVTDFPDSWYIEPRYWPDAARDNDTYHTWPANYIDRFTNQDPTHECTCHALRACFEAAWNRQRQIAVGPPVAGQKKEISAKSASVWVSSISIYAEANPRQYGGAGCRQVLGIAARRGFLPEPLQPRDYGFKHTLHGTCGKGNVTQSRGAWVPVSKFPDGWQETAKHFRPVEYIFPETWEQTVCLVLHGIAVGVGRAGHSIPYTKWIVSDNAMEYTDSYDVLRYDSVSRIKSTAGGSYAIVSTTVPDDWTKPAG